MTLEQLFSNRINYQWNRITQHQKDNKYEIDYLPYRRTWIKSKKKAEGWACKKLFKKRSSGEIAILVNVELSWWDNVVEINIIIVLTLKLQKSLPYRVYFLVIISSWVSSSFLHGLLSNTSVFQREFWGNSDISSTFKRGRQDGGHSTKIDACHWLIAIMCLRRRALSQRASYFVKSNIKHY